MGKNVWNHGHIERLYFSNCMRIHLICVSDTKIWETEYWKQNYPELSYFLINVDCDYGEKEEDYIIIMNQFYAATYKSKWVKRGLRKMVKKEIKKHLFG